MSAAVRFPSPTCNRAPPTRRDDLGFCQNAKKFFTPPPPSPHTHFAFFVALPRTKKTRRRRMHFPPLLGTKNRGGNKKKEKNRGNFFDDCDFARAGKKSEEGGAPFSWWLHLPPPLSRFFSGWISSQAEKWILTSKRSSLCSFWVQKCHFYLGEGRKRF